MPHPTHVMHHGIQVDPCVAMACDLYEAYDNKFPEWWRVIDFRLARLRRIFRFFCAMRPLVAAARTEPSPLLDLLHGRLRARVETGAEGLVLPATDPALRSQIEMLSGLQLEAMGALGLGLIGPGFDLFASGALSTAPQAVKPRILDVDTPFDPPEPDSGAFFYWAEFALLAWECNVDRAMWRAVLPTLLRAERIFIRCYGSDVSGKVRAGMRFSWYDRRRSEASFVPVDPQDAEQYQYNSHRTLTDFERAATLLARQGLPGGAD